jgi:hypothetical protein|nr:MAG TPA: hypothetical protein [Caudoviricetes sp.]
MLLKIYGVISILNIILGLKLKNDLNKNTEFVEELLTHQLGRVIYDRHIKRRKLIMNSILPIYNLFTLIENSTFFIFNIFKDKEGNNAMLEVLKDFESEVE